MRVFSGFILSSWQRIGKGHDSLSYYHCADGPSRGRLHDGCYLLWIGQKGVNMASTNEQYLAYLLRRKEELEGLEMAQAIEEELGAKVGCGSTHLLYRVKMNGGGSYIHQGGKWQPLASS